MRFSAVFILSLCLGVGAFFAPQGLQAQCPTGKERVPVQNAKFERQVLDLVNKERKQRKLKALKWDNDLALAARFHAKDMHDKNYLEHETHYLKDGKLVAGCSYDDRAAKFSKLFANSENIAAGQKTPEEVMKSWMRSSGHRHNIMDEDAAFLGVGYFNGYWVQCFGSKDDEDDDDDDDDD